ncbi:MAG: ATP-binding protein [Acidobacteriota bacterium]
MSCRRAFAKEIDSLEGIFSFLGDFFARERIAAGPAFAIQLVVEELFTNLVKYNVPARNPVEVALARVGDEVRIELVDRDVDPFDPTSAPEVDVDAPLAARQPGGLGLHLVRAVVDRVSFEWHDRVMRIGVVKNLERADV